MIAQSLAGGIEGRMREVRDPARAERERRYLKSDLEHIGVTVPGMRKIVRTVLAEHAQLTHDELVELVTALWARPVHECRMAAVEVLEARTAALAAADIQLIERLLRESRTWALVDGLAASVTGNLVERCPELGSTLDRWSTDGDFWIRRAALLALLVALRRGEGDFERFARYADAMLDDREFFVRKAIGWVLRDTARKRPDLVYDWLEPRAPRVSTVTLREAIKPLSNEQRDAIATARSAGHR